MLSIQVHAGSLNQRLKEECAKKMFLDHSIVKCSVKDDCKGCDFCESDENIDFALRNQLALVVTFGPGEKGAPPVEKQVFYGNGRSVPKSSKLTVIFNNGPGYLKGFFYNNDIIEIINDIVAFSWLPHDYITKNGHHRNQILESYLDKPLFPECSDLFREEQGLSAIVNPNANVERYELLTTSMNTTRTI